MNKHFIMKWSVTFVILTLWTTMVVSGAFTSAQGVTELYVQNEASIEKATSAQVEDILFTKAFSIEDVTQKIPSPTCNARSTGGEITYEGQVLQGKSDVHFHLELPNANLGSGEGSFQTADKRAYFTYNIVSLKKNTETLEIEIAGDLFDSGVKKPLMGTITLDKETQLITVSTPVLTIQDASGDIISGCLDEEKQVTTFIVGDDLETPRSIDEVREVLNNNPELINQFEGLKHLFTRYWWLGLTSPAFVS